MRLKKIIDQFEKKGIEIGELVKAPDRIKLTSIDLDGIIGEYGEKAIRRLDSRLPSILLSTFQRDKSNTGINTILEEFESGKPIYIGETPFTFQRRVGYDSQKKHPWLRYLKPVRNFLISFAIIVSIGSWTADTIIEPFLLRKYAKKIVSGEGLSDAYIQFLEPILNFFDPEGMDSLKSAPFFYNFDDGNINPLYPLYFNQEFEKCIELSDKAKEQGKPYHEVGLLSLCRTEQYDRTIKEFNRNMHMSEEIDGHEFYAVGFALMKKGDYEEAIEYFKKGIKHSLEESYVWVYSNLMLGISLEASERYGEARNHYQICYNVLNKLEQNQIIIDPLRTENLRDRKEWLEEKLFIR